MHLADILHLSAGTVHLSTDMNLSTDALICATGWKHTPPINFTPPGIEEILGLPHYSSRPPGHCCRRPNSINILPSFATLASTTSKSNASIDHCQRYASSPQRTLSVVSLHDSRVTRNQRHRICRNVYDDLNTDCCANSGIVVDGISGREPRCQGKLGRYEVRGCPTFAVSQVEISFKFCFELSQFCIRYIVIFRSSARRLGTEIIPQGWDVFRVVQPLRSRRLQRSG